MPKQWKYLPAPVILLCSALIFSCAYRYEEVRIRRPLTMGYASVAVSVEPKDVSKTPTRQKIDRTSYYAVVGSSKPYALMNDRGVKSALEGRFSEAEILFKEALKDHPQCAPAMNNLGVVYDIFGRRKEAFEWFSRACLIEPENDIFRANFLSSSETGIK